jgi:hypothetical protein
VPNCASVAMGYENASRGTYRPDVPEARSIWNSVETRHVGSTEKPVGTAGPANDPCLYIQNVTEHMLTHTDKTKSYLILTEVILLGC